MSLQTTKSVLLRYAIFRNLSRINRKSHALKMSVKLQMLVTPSIVRHRTTAALCFIDRRFCCPRFPFWLFSKLVTFYSSLILCLWFIFSTCLSWEREALKNVKFSKVGVTPAKTWIFYLLILNSFLALLGLLVWLFGSLDPAILELLI